MNTEKKDKKYSAAVRLLGFFCTLLFMGSLLVTVIAGVSFTSGFLMATSFAGIIGPSVAVNDGVFETLMGIFEIMIEAIQTLFEVIFDVISSIFG